MTTATATAETCACARCGALVIIPDYRPAWIYDGLCMDCAAAPDANDFPGVMPAIAAPAVDHPNVDIVRCRNHRRCGMNVLVSRRRRPNDDMCVDCANTFYGAR